MSENNTSTAESHGADDEQARAWDSWEEAKVAGRHALNRLDRVLGGSFGHHE